MEYNFREIEKKWQKYWYEKKIYKVNLLKDRPKYYVLDMFPYPSGAGLHVGHPLGYIASDIYTRYKRLKGFNVLHPMGFDAFGLPAEQFAIQTGQHPAITTKQNITRYKEQLKNLGLSYDWEREVITSDPAYYKWTQWTFIQLFKSWYNKEINKAEPLETLINKFSESGTENVYATQTKSLSFSAQDWVMMNEKEQQAILMNYRLAYLADTMVNWCPSLGTVLANDEVKEGFSVRGNHPVERKLMQQWLLRVTAYAERLINDMLPLEWSDSLKEMQRNWIGRSEGASVEFAVKDSALKLDVFTTRPDTIFGSTFMVVAPEHVMLEQLTKPENQEKVKKYAGISKNRSERERMTEVKKVSGEFTGSYVINPFNGREIPVWVADYVLAGYGTGAIMAVPAHDSRDYAFAKHFELPIIEVVSGGNIAKESYDAKQGIMINSGFLNGLNAEEAIKEAINRIESEGIGKGQINYRLRDAIFSRQRYWGEPFPIYYKEGIAYALDEQQLPLELPEVDSFLPTETGEPPLARAKNWENTEGHPYECSTMPGFAGSSGYYLRYMDPQNNSEYFSEEANSYWQDVDLYIGGAEHATGHLIYSRFWNKFLFDRGYVCKAEPFKKLINQGMIQGRSSFVYRIKGENTFVSKNLIQDYDTIPLNVEISLVDNDVLDTEGFRRWRADFSDAEFILEDGQYVCGHAVEKMSKSLYNVVNPDELVEKYGADTLRCYEMFLGPLELSKPWDTNGIEGVFRFIRKLWRLYHNDGATFYVNEAAPSAEEMRILHKTIKRMTEDIERFSFNTVVSTLMICVNELTELQCNKKSILKDLAVLISPYTPHLAEELWSQLGNKDSIVNEIFPTFDPKFTEENNVFYPVSFNGKTRFKLELPKKFSVKEIEDAVMHTPEIDKWLEGKTVKKIIVVPGKIINIVI